MGTERTGSKVRPKWQDLKSRMKKKAANLQNDMVRTGGGSSTCPKLTDFDEKVLSLMGDTCIDGVLPSAEADILARRIIIFCIHCISIILSWSAIFIFQSFV